MRVVEPLTITDDILISSTIVENDHPEWAVGTSYTTGDRVIVLDTHRIYEAVTGSTGQDPTTDTTATYWLDIGATNRWKAFDKLISDPATRTTQIIYTLEPGAIADAIAFFGVVAATIRVRCIDADDTELFNEIRSMVDNGNVFDGFTYVFEPIAYETQEIFNGLPIYSGVTVEISLAGDGEVRVGQIVIGRDQILGTTIVGTGIGIEDFSRKDRDAFGNAILVERAFAQMVDFQFAFPTDDARRVTGVLARLRATPAVYYAGSDTSQLGTTVYGFYRDYSIPLTTNRSFASLEVEGLT